MTATPSVLFVCMGNICRSPSAEGVFRDLLIKEGLKDKVRVDSAGTHAYHIGDPPDPRSIEHALRRGVDLRMLRARQVNALDFEDFDYILAMDGDNYDRLLSKCPKEYQPKVRLFLEYAQELKTREVPDPYYGGHQGFEHVLDLVEAASRGLLEAMRAEHSGL